MAVTKTYHYFIQFARGSVDITNDINDRSALEQPLVRARDIPGHRIVIEAHEDRADPCEIGVAMPRLEVLRQYFLAESVEEDRIELLIHAENCCTEEFKHRELCRHADIYLFPQVTSLFPDVGGRLLSLREYRGLESARGVTFKVDDVTCKKLEGEFTKVEWKRILGYETLREWLEAGAYHHYFVSAGLNISPKYT